MDKMNNKIERFLSLLQLILKKVEIIKKFGKIYFLEVDNEQASYYK